MGENQKFTACYAKYAGYVKRIAVDYLNDYYDAEDVSQDVFIKFYERLEFFKDENDIKAWLRVVTKNRAIDVRRKLHKNKIIYVEDYADDEAYKYRAYKESVEDYMLKKELIAKILTSINKMGLDLKNTISTHCTLDVPQEKACKTLGIKVGTYRVRLFRARKYLKMQFENELKEIL